MSSHTGINWIIKYCQIAALSTLAFASASYATTIHWYKHCSRYGQLDKSSICGQFFVPISYKGSKQKKLPLEVYMHKHTAISNQYHGILLLNFGGPWLENTTTLIHYLKQRKASPSHAWLGEKVIQDYDIVTFDPRGIDHIHNGNRISCRIKSNSTRKLYTHLDTISHEMVVRNHLPLYFSTVSRMHELCTYTAPRHAYLYREAYTKNTVKDMNRLITLLTQKKHQTVSYYGRSYGTRLGLAFLLSNPGKIKRMIFDGNMAPNNSYKTFIKDTAKSDDIAFKHLFALCAEAKNKCPLFDPAHGLKSARQMLNSYTALTYYLRSHHKIMSPHMLARLSFDELPSPHTQALQDYMRALRSAILFHHLSTIDKLYQLDTNSKGGTYINNYEDTVTSAVICTDYRDTYFISHLGQWRKFIQSIMLRFPLIGYEHALDLTTYCLNWPDRQLNKPHPLLTSPPKDFHTKTHVLLIGNQFDPEAPLQWSKNVARLLKKLHVPHTLLYWPGMGHTAFFDLTPVNGCVNKYVNQFLNREHLLNFHQVNCIHTQSLLT